MSGGLPTGGDPEVGEATPAQPGAEPGTPLARCHLRVRGRVQRVGFRRFVQRTAASLGLAGWVRNRRDGTVELLAVGPPGALVALRWACASGPPGARVEGVEEEPDVASEGLGPPGGPSSSDGRSPFTLLPDA